jgi:two-component sensor histidine kinase
MVVATGALCGATAGVAISGGHRSSFFSTSVCLTALGAGVLDPPGGWRYGLAAGTGVLAAQTATGRPGERIPWRGYGWWLGTPGLYAGAGYVGAQLNRATRLTRSLETTIRAEEASVAQPLNAALAGFTRIVDEMRAVANDLRRYPPAFSTGAAAAADVEATINRLGLVVPQVLRAAQRSIPAAELLPAVRRVALAYGSGARTLHVEADETVPAVLDARATSVLVAVLNRTLENVEQHGDAATRVDIELARKGERVTLRVSDNGGGKPGSEGTGTRLSRQEAALAGGSFDWWAGDRGVVVEVMVQAAAAASEPTLYSEQVSDIVEACLDVLRRTTLTGSALMLALADDLPRRGLKTQRRAATAAILAGEALRWVPNRTMRSGARFAVACLAASVGRHSKRPPLSGWLATNAFALAFRLPRAALPVGLAASASLTLAAVPDDTRSRDEIFTVWGERSFPLLASLLASQVARLLPPVVERERRLGAASTRVAAMDALVHTVRTHHDILGPLEKEAPEGELFSDERVGRLHSLERALRQTVNELGAALRPDDELIEALGAVAAERVAPVPVWVRLDPTVRIAYYALDGADLEARARRTGLRHAVGELVDGAAAAVPPTILGRRRLDGVMVALSPDAQDGRARVSARPVPNPRNTRSRTTPGRLVEALSTLGGHLSEGFDDGVLAFTVPEAALQ